MTYHTVTFSDALSIAAQTYSDREAFRFRDETLSFDELDQRATDLAVALVQDGCEKGDRIGVYLGKGLESIVAVYGIMRAGAAWVPLDPRTPLTRLGVLLHSYSIRQLITDQPGARCLQNLVHENQTIEAARVSLFGPSASENPFKSTSWDEISGMANRTAMTNSLPVLAAGDLAYIMVTSGSTGEPKGICHTHGSGLAYAHAAVETFCVGRRDVLSGFPPLNFDQSTFHLFSGVLTGARTVLIPDEFGSFPVNLARLIADEGITVWYSVPYVLIQLMTRGTLDSVDLSALRWVKFGGEIMPAETLANWMSMTPDCRYANIYGPAEVNQCTHYVVTHPPAASDTIPIGKPWSAARILILDENDQPVKPGESGLLLVQTKTMMRGYWGKRGEQSDCFYPSDSTGDERFYRTGDLVKERPDGELEFLGRSDRQVKTRGFRVELEEVEAALQSFAGISEAAVYLVAVEDGSQVIEAAVMAHPDVNFATTDVLQFLQKQLPRYALPREIRQLNRFPRTASGKIDRRALALQFQEITGHSPS